LQFQLGFPEKAELITIEKEGKLQSCCMHQNSLCVHTPKLPTKATPKGTELIKDNKSQFQTQ